VSSISASLNYLLSSNFSEFGRVNNTSALSGNGRAGKDLRASLSGLKEGTSVSARTDYKVGPNGQLVPTNTTVTIGTTPDSAGLRNPRSGVIDERPKSFSDLLKPKPALEPADEALLFAATAKQEDENNSPNTTILQNAAEDENGEVLDVEVIVPGKATAPELSAQRQQAASNLYARNNDIIYSIDPAVQFAA